MTKTIAATAAWCLLAAAVSVQAEGATYAIDPTHTFATFEVRHFGTSTVRGRFDRTQGSVVLDKAARSGRAEITIDAASINSGIAAFDAHLKNKDFLDVTVHPTARFVGDRFTFDANDKLASVQGQLTLLGQTQPVTLVAKHYDCYDNPRIKREVCGGDFEATIQRSQWGMTFGLPGIPDSVRLVIQIEAARQP